MLAGRMESVHVTVTFGGHKIEGISHGGVVTVEVVVVIPRIVMVTVVVSHVLDPIISQILYTNWTCPTTVGLGTYVKMPFGGRNKVPVGGGVTRVTTKVPGGMGRIPLQDISF